MPELPRPRVPHCRDLKDDAQVVQAGVVQGNQGIDAPRFIPERVPSEAVLDDLRETGHGVAPDLIYAKGVPDIPSPSSGVDFDKRAYSLLIFEVGFCADLSCHIKRNEKAGKYAPLLAKL